MNDIQQISTKLSVNGNHYGAKTDYKCYFLAQHMYEIQQIYVELSHGNVDRNHHGARIDYE